MRTGVNYSVDANPDNGRRILEDFFRLTFMTGTLYGFDECSSSLSFQWIFRFLGRLLLGKNTKKEFVIFIGEKDSGKTTFVNLLKDILGSYADQLKDADIIKPMVSNDVARSFYTSKDKRLLVYSEGSKSQKLNTQTLKRITGDSSLTVKDISFTINGKIIEDSNYIPFPDNIDDQAFNDRLVIIPFMKNEGRAQSEVNRIISSLFEGQADIFAFMVSEATNGIEDEKRDTPPCSVFIKHMLGIVRDPVQAFYNEICIKSHEDAVVPAKTLHKAYHEWMHIRKAEIYRKYPYLRSELHFEIHSDTAFNRRIQEIHPGMPEHRTEGKVFTHLEINSPILCSLGITLLPDPIKQQKINMLNTAEQAEKVSKAISDSVESNMKLEKALAEKSKTLFPQYGAGFASFPVQPTWSYNPLLPVFPACVEICASRCP
jgi:hypothetical protein